MVNEVASSPASEYLPARSRTASIESGQTRRRSAAGASVSLAPLSVSENGRRSQIGVSCNAKRQFKDRRIYVNPRTGLPVRPPTSFGLFKHALRRSMGSKVSFLDFNKRATEQWARLRDEDKEPYSRRARELSDQFKKIEVHFLRKKVRSLLEQAKAHRRLGGGGGGGSSSGGRRAATTSSSSSSAAAATSSTTTKKQIGNTARV